MLTTLLRAGLMAACVQSAVVWAEAAADDARALALLQTHCTACHQLDRLAHSSGYSRAGWDALIDTMVALPAGSERRAMVQYLAKQFPENQRRSPKLQTGKTTLVFKEWVVPTLGQRARDPVQAPDGSIWWAGQWGNVIGRIDPTTGEMREYPLPPRAMPHSVTADAAGNIWYTGNRNGTVGMLNPNTGKLTEYPMPDSDARDPHTAIFDRHGMLWFTLQHSNKVGRLDPASGAIQLIALPTPNARPYGIKLDAQGAPWVACNGSNCLVKVNPQTMAVTTYRLPDPQTRVRRLDFAEDGMLWYVNSSLGRLGRFDTTTGKAQEWASPSGPDAHPYAIAVLDGGIWYNESGMRPDTLVRFDPEQERFESWPIPSGNIYAGIVRHMRATREGELLIHQSATNRILRVEIQSKP